MSDDEGVTPLQAALEAAPARVTPAPGKGALGTRWPRAVGTLQTQCWVTRRLHRGEGAMQTPPRRGEGCASTAVSRCGGRSALRNGYRAEARTGLGKSDRPGSQRGFRKRGQSEHELRAARAPDFYLDPSALTRTLGSVRGAPGNGRPYRDRCNASIELVV
jgi:hypothetical protein